MKIASLYVFLSTFFFTLSVLSQSLSVQEKATIDSLNNLSFELRSINRSEALRVAELAILLNNGDYTEGFSTSYMNKGIVYEGLDNADSSFHYLLLSADYFESLGGLNYGINLYYLGRISVFVQSWDQALDYYEKAKKIFETESNWYFLAAVEHSIGTIYLYRYRTSKALEYFLRSYEMKLDKGLDYASELTTLSIAYYTFKDYAKSLEFGRKALEFHVENGDTLGIVKDYSSIAMSYLDIKPDSAIFFYEIGLKLARKMEYRADAAVMLNNMADAHIQMGNYGRAKSLLHEVLSKEGILPNSYNHALYKLAEVYKETDQYDSVISYGLRAFRNAKNADISATAKDVAGLLVEAFTALNKQDSAIKYLKEIIVLKDSISQGQSRKLFSDLRVQIETIKKRREIDLLKKQREVDEANQSFIILIFILFFLISMVVAILWISRQKIQRKKRELDNLHLKNDIERKRQELHQQTLHMINLSNRLNDVEEDLRSLNGRKTIGPGDIQKTLNKIFVNKSLAKEWELFDDYFSQINPKFKSNLLKKSESLSTQDYRLAVLVKMDLKNREIANLLNIEQKSVRMSRYRLKRKLALDEEEDLGNFIRSIMN